MSKRKIIEETEQPNKKSKYEEDSEYEYEEDSEYEYEEDSEYNMKKILKTNIKTILKGKIKKLVDKQKELYNLMKKVIMIKYGKINLKN